MKQLNKEAQELLEAIVGCKNYWLNLDDKIVEQSIKFCGDNETPTEYRMNGLIHSICTLLDGDSSANDFKRYKIVSGRKHINKDIDLHSNIFDFIYPSNKN